MAQCSQEEEIEEPDCRYCGEPVDPLEPGHYKSPGDKIAHADCVADHCYEDRECVPVSRREPFPGVEEDYECLDCDWGGHGTDLQGPDGECPECDSRSVRVIEA